MRKIVSDLYFEANFSLPITIIIEAAEEQWGKIFDICSGLIRKFHGRVKNIYFLGNTKEYKIYTYQDFDSNAPGWFNENKNRVSLIGRILDNILIERNNGMIVVFYSKEIIDIKDWENSEIFERLILVNVNKNSLANIEKIENPVEKIYIKGLGFAPLSYNYNKVGNYESDVNYNNGEFILTINGNKESLSGHLKCICNEELPKLFVKRLKGSIEEIILKKENPWLENPEWISIPENLMEIINSGIMKKDYLCPICGKKHQYNILLCPEGGNVLRGFPLNTTILIKKNEYLSLTSWYSFPLNCNERIIAKDGSIYDWEEAKWKFKRKIDLYEEVDNGIWAIYHRI